MAFFYSLCYPVSHCPNIYPFVPQLQPQLQKTTILISNAQSFGGSFIKNNFDISNLNTNTTVLDQHSSSETKTEVKLMRKPTKKENLRKQDENFGRRNQNKDRNVLSGILKGYIQFVMNSPKVRQMLENLSKKIGLENGRKMFYQVLTQTFPHRKSYVGIKQIRKLLRGQGVGREVSKLLAVSLRYYLLEVYPLQLYNSGQKQNKKAKVNLLKKVRKLKSSLFQF